MNCMADIKYASKHRTVFNKEKLTIINKCSGKCIYFLILKGILTGSENVAFWKKLYLGYFIRLTINYKKKKRMTSR